MRDKYSIGRVIASLDKKQKEKMHLTAHQHKVLLALEQCRTAALGGHVDLCPDCGCTQISYNSCRNRHCPLCQGHAREKWIAARKKDVLPVKYYHVVFTLPDKLNQLILTHKKELYGLLFNAAWKTIDKFFTNKGLQGGMIALLHTWGSSLQFHPHLHCIVPGGGINHQGKWRFLQGANNETPYLFPVKAMSKVFKAKFLAGLSHTLKLNANLRKRIYRQQWVVYSKRSMKNDTVIDYLGRYSHRVAITNRRITHFDRKTVRFAYKDYKRGGTNKEMVLSCEEFIRRFCLHILPTGFVRIRHFGFLASSNKEKLEEIKKQTATKELACTEIITTRVNSYLCPHCGLGYMVCIKIISPPARAPPFTHLDFITNT